jgi:predicted RNase H-like nuclease
VNERSGAIVAGLDGCRRGWVMVSVPADDPVSTQIEVVTDLGRVFDALDSGELASAAIDIPIGLPETGARSCDLEARKLIGARRNSVFPAPPRGLLGARSYGEAASRSRAIQDKGISKQAFAIMAKIAEVDALMTPARQERFVEIHPEVSFTVLAGTPMTHYKRDSAGRVERLAWLRGVFRDVDRRAAVRIAHVHPDDVIDAHVAAWSARRWLERRHCHLGGLERDARGLRMEMIA